MHSKIQPLSGGATIFLDLQEGWRLMKLQNKNLSSALRDAELQVYQEFIQNILVLNDAKDIQSDHIKHPLVSINLYNGKETLYLGGEYEKVFTIKNASAKFTPSEFIQHL